jgi:excisionase family DNA binding protein
MARNRPADNPQPQQLSLDDWVEVLAAERSAEGPSGVRRNRTDPVRSARATASARVQERASGAPDQPHHEGSETSARQPTAQRDKSAETALDHSHDLPPRRADLPASVHGDTRLLTTNEAASLLRVHPRTVQRLVERGQLRAVHLGTAVRFDPRDVAGLITRFKCAPASSAMDDLLGPRVRSTRAVLASTSFRDRVRSRD